ncbi:hypothetical protein [Sphingobium sp.]|uniref:hypothetical protein n=1 Tax=Sphingobium sp. TaxID=1912891 RepID=UPI0028BDA89A|nr:hypothetical protein [Sphingobium sp.]
MFYDKAMLGAGNTASPAPANTLQAISDFDITEPARPAHRGSSAFPEAQKGTWFDEGYDFREPVGTAMTTAVLAAIAIVDTRKIKRCDEDQHNHEMLVRKLIANAIRCTSFHNPALVAVQLRASAYKGKPVWLNGKAMARTTKLLADAGLIERVKGRHKVAATTLTASPALLFMALEAGATEQALIYRMPGDRTLRLREGNRDTELMAFGFNKDRRSWATRLEDYSAFLGEQDIGVALSPEEVAHLTARMNKERSRGKLAYVKPELLRKCLYRQFNNGSFDDGGRLYGGWWINCPKELRKRITINGKPTVELDFSGCLIRMLYHLDGIDYQDDPYLLAPLVECEDAHGLGEAHFREPVKRMMQALINGREGKRNERIRMPSRQTFRPYFSRIEVAEMLKAKHAPIAGSFFSEAGIKLQRRESDIALDIITNLKAKGITCLPIHDSFIVDAEQKDELKNEMIFVYKSSVGYNPIIK